MSASQDDQLMGGFAGSKSAIHCNAMRYGARQSSRDSIPPDMDRRQPRAVNGLENIGKFA